MTNEEQRIAELKNTMHQMVDHYINALGILINQVVLNRADPNPSQWIQAYLENMRATLETLISDQTKAQRPPMDELQELEGLLLEAEQRKKAPGNQ